MRADQELRNLQIEFARIQSENTRLRKRVHERNRHTKRIDQAYSDAILLAVWRQGGVQASRRLAALHKMSQRRWQNAIGLLRMARIVVGHRRWSTCDLVDIEPRLCKARQYAIDSPAAYHARLNRHAQTVTIH